MHHSRTVRLLQSMRNCWFAALTVDLVTTSHYTLDWLLQHSPHFKRWYKQMHERLHMLCWQTF